MNKRKFDWSQWSLSVLSHFPVTFNIRRVWSASWKDPDPENKWHHLISMTLATIRGQFGPRLEFFACLSSGWIFWQADVTASVHTGSLMVRYVTLYRAWQRRNAVLWPQCMNVKSWHSTVLVPWLSCTTGGLTVHRHFTGVCSCLYFSALFWFGPELYVCSLCFSTSTLQLVYGENPQELKRWFFFSPPWHSEAN